MSFSYIVYALSMALSGSIYTAIQRLTSPKRLYDLTVCPESGSRITVEAQYPGKIFSASCNYSNCIRISFGKPWDDDADYGLMMLGKLIQKMM